MITLECKIKATKGQYEAIDEAIRTARFCRNKALRYWMDRIGNSRFDLNSYMTQLGKEFDFANKLNSQARQSSADWAWSGIQRFYDNCKAKIPGKKGYPKFKKRSRSVEYKTSGWKLSDNRKTIKFTDGFNIGTVKLKGSRDLNFYSLDQIKRVRIVRRADGYYVQFCVKIDRQEPLEPTGSAIGLDVGLNHYYTDSNGETVGNPRFLRKSERLLKRRQRQVSRKKKGSSNRRKAIKKLARKHLQVSRQRKDFVVKTTRNVCISNDIIVYEDLKIKNMVKSHNLAKSISDASWYLFRQWLEYFGNVFGRVTVPVAPQYTSQNCSTCGQMVKKARSARTHICGHCGTILDRDHNAAINILNKGLSKVGHT